MKGSLQAESVDPSKDFQNLSRRPRRTRFQQQKLRAWSPNYDAKVIGRYFLGSSIIYLIIGCTCLALSFQVDEFGIDYTNCQNSVGDHCSDILQNRSFTKVFYTCECFINFTIKKDFKAPIYFYYILSNFYQNYRSYVQSRDDLQLSGVDSDYVDEDCEPRRFEKYNKIIYAPCGSVANSKFNDSFSLFYEAGNKTLAVAWTDNNIAWIIDKNVKFGQPSKWNHTVKPENWKMTPLERNSFAYSGDEEFLVWMRTASLQDFKKLHRIIHGSVEPFDDGLPSGLYTLKITYAYPVIGFYGSKAVYFSTTNIMGGKTVIMPVIFLLLSFIHFILAMVLNYLERFSHHCQVADPEMDALKASISTR